MWNETPVSFENERNKAFYNSISLKIYLLHQTFG